MTRPLSHPLQAVATPLPSLHVAGIGVALAPTCETVAEAAEDLRLDAGEQKMFTRLFGFSALPFEAAAPFASLLRRATADLCARFPRLPAPTQVCHCHTLPTVRLHDAAFGIHDGAEQVSLGMAHCATGLAAFEMLRDTLGADDSALVLIGERAFHRRIRLINDTTLMGEAAVALHVTRGQGAYQILGSHVSHDGCAALSRGHPTEQPQIGRDYTSFVADHLSATFERLGIAASDIDLLLPHNVNMVSWHPIARAAGLSPKSIYLRNVARVAHCFGADPFINLVDAHRDGAAKTGQTVLLTSVGMGLSAASILVRICSDMPDHP